MKAPIAIFLFLLLNSVPCWGQTKSSSNPSRQKLYSNWLYLNGSGGISGKGPGWTKESKVSIQFKKNGKYTFFENGKKMQGDKFKIVEKESMLSGKKVLIIDYKNNTDQSFQIVGDTLFLQEEVHDGFNTVFLKK